MEPFVLSAYMRLSEVARTVQSLSKISMLSLYSSHDVNFWIVMAKYKLCKKASLFHMMNIGHAHFFRACGAWGMIRITVMMLLIWIT